MKLNKKKFNEAAAKVTATNMCEAKKTSAELGKPDDGGKIAFMKMLMDTVIAGELSSKLGLSEEETEVTKEMYDKVSSEMCSGCFESSKDKGEFSLIKAMETIMFTTYLGEELFEKEKKDETEGTDN